MNPVWLSIATGQHTALADFVSEPLLLRSKSQSLPQGYFISLLHLFSHGDLDALDVQRTPYTNWHMASASTCALPGWLHLASLPHFDLMLLLFLELLLHSPAFGVQQFHRLVVIEDLCADL